MNKYVVLGVNENPKYLYYLPLVVWAWRKFGWEPFVFYAPKDTSDRMISPLESLVFGYKKCWQVEVNGYDTSTLAQVSRLYATCMSAFNGGDYFLTSDCDMLPLSNYWEFTHPGITTWGRDLTDYHYPICYIGMGCNEWESIMDVTEFDYNEMIKRDLDIYAPKAKNVWCVDQDIITERLLRNGKEKITHINRGTDKRTGYPIGRVDRSNWRLDHEILIDAHLPHDILTNEKSFHKVMELLHHVWPGEDFKWFVSYHKEFKKLL